MGIFCINNRIEVYYPGEKAYFKSLIQERNENSIAIGVPLHGKKNLDMKQGSIWEFRITWKDGQYYFSSEVLGQKLSDRIPLYIIRRPQIIRRQQRRSFYRFPCSLKVYYKVVEGHKGTGNANRSLLAGIMINLSGGGGQLVVSRYHPPGTILIMNFFTEERKPKKFVLQGMVLRCTLINVPGRLQYRLGIEFTEIDEQAQDELIRYIFTCLRRRPI